MTLDGSLSRINALSLAARVADRLRAAITRGELRGGTRLNQDEVAERLGVSRSPVRLAISELLSDGLVDRSPSGGVFVRPLRMSDVRSALVVREVVETRAVMLLVDASERAIATVVETFERHNSVIEAYTVVERLQADKEFHLSILEASENPFLVMAVRPVWPIVERAMWELLQMQEMYVIAWSEHRALVDRIQNRDGTTAATLLTAHLNGARDRLATALASIY